MTTTREIPLNSDAPRRILRTLSGVVVGLLPALLVALAVGGIVPSAITIPLMAAAYLSYLGVVFLATACLLQRNWRLAGAGMALGAALAMALYVVALYGATLGAY
jgi:hypothetical protein